MAAVSGADRSTGLSRRSVLRWGALAILAPPLLSACGPNDNTAPNGVDQLTPFYAAALADVATANAAAKAFPADAPTFQVLAQVRQTHATALANEIGRAAASTTAPSMPPATPDQVGSDESGAIAAMVTALNHSAASTLVRQVPRYRAGLVASICGGCASLAMALNGSPAPTAAQTDQLLAAGTNPPTTALPANTADALQKALAAEHAAFWICGTANAFLNGTAINAATIAHQVRRDTAERIVSAGGATPQQSQAAYSTPQPIADQSSALAALAIAEQDAEVAWRAVAENTDDQTLRWAGQAGLTGAALWQTAWRHLAGTTPASIAMPGQPS
ncbi:MAG TPA: DUF4439 domain-containing protein [Pseudonocardiaceae bacterium]|jgi:hypothetical protein